ncbi:MAG: hypothetical protein IPK50_05815 [Fibrobacterota bacterium]|nr:hypothetical protein [Fibrobacterota bacterium]QQS06412.1 MAG: hypothetical protein IPK50_05815 [Fibrobacterota bacterium]
MLNPAAPLPLHRKSLHTLLLFLAAFTLSTPLVSCGDGPKAKGKTFGHVNKKEAISLGVIASETNIDSAEKKYLGKEFTFKDLLPGSPDPISDDYSSRNKCGFEFYSRDMKVTLTAWINTQPRWDGGNREWKRYLPYDKVTSSEALKMNIDVCSSQQDAACTNQYDSLVGSKVYMPTKSICNFAPENLYASGRIAEIRKYETKSGSEWKVILITTGIAN